MVLDATLTRAGVFLYPTTSGVVRELRPPEEVFRADSLASLRDLPVTDRHPPPGRVTPQNTRTYRRGHVSGEAKRVDGDLVSGVVVIDDEELISAIDRRDRTEISCGYTCDTEETPGEWNGQPYDRVQRNIQYNHVAVVERGRAGASVRLRIDSDGDMTIEEETKGSETMKSVRIDGIEYPLNTPAEIEAAIAAHNRSVAKTAETIANLTSEGEKAKGRADAAEEKIRSLEAKLSDALDPKRLDAAVSARASLVTSARAVLGPEFKADGLSDEEIMRRAIAKKSPGVKLEGRSSDYLRARFDALTETISEADPDGLSGLRQSASTRSDSDDRETRTDTRSPRERMQASNAERATKPLAISRN